MTEAVFVGGTTLRSDAPTGLPAATRCAPLPTGWGDLPQSGSDSDVPVLVAEARAFRGAMEPQHRRSTWPSVVLCWNRTQRDYLRKILGS